MVRVDLATSDQIALPAPGAGVGYGGGFGLELNDTDPTIPAGSNNAPLSFDTAYTLEDNASTQSPVSTSYMTYDGGTTLTVLQEGWYQLAWEISFQREIDDDGVMLLSLHIAQKQDNANIALARVDYSGDSRLLYCTGDAELGLYLSSRIAADIDVTYAAAILTPMFVLASS